MGNAALWDCTEEEYFSDASSVSRSDLDLILKDPALYQAVVIDRTLQRADTEFTSFGSLIHSIVATEGDPYAKFIRIPPTVLARNGSRAGKAYQEFSDAHKGKWLLKDQEASQVELVVGAIFENKSAKMLLEAEGEYERALRWVHSDFPALTLRCRIDKLLRSCIVDVKTTQSTRPQAFVRTIVKYGYHRQAAFYQDAVYELTGGRLPFVFIGVTTNPPYTCETYDLDEDFIRLGREQYEFALRRLVACQQSNTWRTATHGEIFTLSAPGWAAQEQSWEPAEDAE